MRARTFIFLALALICGSLPELLYAQTELIERSVGDDYTAVTDHARKLITVAGQGRPNPYIEGSMAEHLVFAMTEARRNAYTRMAVYLENLRVDGKNTIANGQIVDNVFRIQMDELVKHARETENQRFFERDGSVRYLSTVGLFITGPNSLNSILIPKLKQQAALVPETQFDLAESHRPAASKVFEPEKAYTGVVIDVRQMFLRPALAPHIYAADGREVYGTIKVSTQYAVNIGVVGYAKNINNSDVTERIGASPLIIRAQGVSGSLKADVIVSNDDAGKILWADQKRGFLSECRVIFWVK